MSRTIFKMQSPSGERSKNVFLCSLHPENGSKCIFYAVSIRRKEQKCFFMQSPYREETKNVFLYSLHPEKGS
jgi:hypothetical protein